MAKKSVTRSRMSKKPTTPRTTKPKKAPQRAGTGTIQSPKPKRTVPKNGFEEYKKNSTNKHLQELLAFMPVWPECKLIELPVKDLNIDHSYQRYVNLKSVYEKALYYCRTAFGVLSVGRRSDGTYWVDDGQRRLEVAKLLGIKTVPCSVYESIGPKMEAVLFTLHNYRDKVDARDVFQASLMWGDERSLGIVAVAEDCGFIIPRKGHAKGSWNAITAVTALQDCYDISPDHLAMTLRIIHAAWTSCKPACEGALLNGVSHFLRSYGDSLSEKVVIDSLRQTSAGRVVDEAKRVTRSGYSRSADFALLITHYYCINTSKVHRVPYDKKLLKSIGIA